MMAINDEEDDSSSIILLEEPNPVVQEIRATRIIKHVEKVHIQIEIDNKQIIELLTSKAIERGGSIHEDNRGRQYLFYPLLSNGNDDFAALCLIHEKDCYLKDRISYHNGEEELEMYGILYFREQHFNAPWFEVRPNLQHYFVMHNSIQFPQEYLNKPKQYQNTTIPIYYTYSEADIENAISLISQSLLLYRTKVESNLCRNIQVFAFVFLLLQGAFSLALNSFWHKMWDNNWQNSYPMQLFYYISYMIEVRLILLSINGMYARRPILPSSQLFCAFYCSLSQSIGHAFKYCAFKVSQASLRFILCLLQYWQRDSQLLFIAQSISGRWLQ
ncbi:hypothetical protein FGO68_gene9896 [Halteria grandinella]|uniref:Uncharacterized protein n=1 Tax=Halteria grandinella TaxID=5974 RepID=A0A8J8NLI7_HALGN|nr:hypothetical protein FGO68_gene9896 [Halteria grandinella]